MSSEYPRVAHIQGYWWVEWAHALHSWMPDESTARLCAAAGRLREALAEGIETVSDLAEQQAEPDYRHVPALDRMRSALALATPPKETTT